MSTRSIAWLARLVWVLSIVLAGFGLANWLVYPASAGGGPDAPPVLGLALAFLPSLLAFPTVGAIVLTRRPKHPIGWLFSLVGLSLGLNVALTGYSYIAVVERPDQLPAGAVIMAITPNVFNIAGLAALLAILLFPTGRLPSPRWRFVPVLVVIGVLLDSLGWLLQPGPLQSFPTVSVDNPLGVASAEALLGVMRGLGAFLLLISVLVVGSSIVVRFRRTQGVERQQLKWFTYAIALMAFGLTGWFVTVLADLPSYSGYVLWGVFVLGLGLVPVAAGIAVLRFRLYEIDPLINRTLVYGTLTASLGVVYVVGVALVQRALSLLGGQESDLALSISTLGIAALFHPMRTRIQAFIDRRFYRHKYDANRLVSAFGATLRNEVDLPALSQQLVDVVWESLHPASVSVWIRPSVPVGRTSASPSIRE